MEMSKGYRYSPRQMMGATFLGTPIAGCILLAHNFRETGQRDKAKKSLIAGTAASILLFVIAYFLPDKFPNSILPLAYTTGFYAVAKELQGKSYDSYIAAGGTRGSGWKVAGIGFACLVAIVAVIFVFVFVAQVE